MLFLECKCRRHQPLLLKPGLTNRFISAGKSRWPYEKRTHLHNIYWTVTTTETRPDPVTANPLLVFIEYFLLQLSLKTKQAVFKANVEEIVFCWRIRSIPVSGFISPPRKHFYFMTRRKQWKLKWREEVVSAVINENPSLPCVHHHHHHYHQLLKVEKLIQQIQVQAT